MKMLSESLTNALEELGNNSWWPKILPILFPSTEAPSSAPFATLLGKPPTRPPALPSQEEDARTKMWGFSPLGCGVYEVLTGTAGAMPLGRNVQGFLRQTEGKSSEEVASVTEGASPISVGNLP